VHFVHDDPASQRLLEQIRNIPDSATAVLVRGERGSGRNRSALAQHCLSGRAGEPLLHFDCSAFPAESVEAELFGDERRLADGRTTVRRRGYLALAAAGTLVIDEIAILPIPAQARLLRAIEEGKFWPAGSSGAVPLEARIVALGTVDLELALARAFREELYHRLKITSLVVPPLRDRPRDVRPLAEQFLAMFAAARRRPQPRLSEAALHQLQQYWFPGNVSELRDLMEHAVLACPAAEIMPQDLPAQVRHPNAAREGRVLALEDEGRMLSLEEMERAYIAEVLDYTRGKKGQAAGILGISRKTLLEKRKRYGLG
jgi:DNA-binding NtrC family response regulator